MATPLILKMEETKRKIAKDLQLRKQLAQQYDDAVKQVRRNIDNPKPVIAQEMTEDQKRENKVMQRQLAFSNLSTIMTPTEANIYLSNYSDDDNNYFINSNFKDILTELKGKINNSARFFNDFMQQYILKWRDTNETGIVRPLTEGMLDNRITLLDNALRDFIGKKLNKNFQQVQSKFDKLRNFISLLPNEISNPIIQQLTDAIQEDNDKYATKIIELIEELKLQGISDISLADILDQLQELETTVKSAMPSTRPKQKTKIEILNEIMTLTGLKEGEIYTRSDGTTNIKLSLKLTRNQLIDILAEIMSDTPENVSVATSATTPMPYMSQLKLPELRIKVPKDMIPFFEDPANKDKLYLYGMINMIPKEDLFKYIESKPKALKEAKLFKGSWKKLNREDLNLFIADLITDLNILTTAELEALPTRLTKSITDYELKPVSSGNVIDTSRFKIRENLAEAGQRIFKGFKAKQELRKLKAEKAEKLKKEKAEKKQRIFRETVRTMRKKTFQDEQEKNKQILQDHNDEVTRLRTSIAKLPDGALPPKGLSKADLLNMVDQYTGNFINTPKPFKGAPQAQIDQYDYDQGRAQKIKTDLEEALNEINASLKGRADPAKVAVLTAEGEALRDRKTELTNLMGQLNDRRANKTIGVKDYRDAYNPLNAELSQVAVRIDNLNREILTLGGKRISGTGKKKIIGKGLLPSSRPRYMTFGKYTIHTPSLDKGLINLKYNSLTSLDKIPPKYVSNKFINIINDLLDDSNNFNKEDYNELNDEERKYFDKIIATCQLNKTIGHKLEINKSDIEELRRFELLKGELISGNNAPQLLQDLKKYILKFINDGRLSKMNGQSLLYEISLLEKN